MEFSRVHAIIILLVALSCPVFRATGQPPQDGARKITVADVQLKTATIKQSYQCRIEPDHCVRVVSPIEGRVASILVKEGQAVKQGDPLFEIGPPRDAETPEAKDRDNLVSIKAPCDGRLVGPLSNRRDSRVRKGGPLATVSDDRAVWVDSEMSERRYLAFITGRGEEWRTQEFELILADNRKYPQTGKMVDFQASFANSNGNIRFRAEFPNPDRVLRPGQTATLVMNRVLKDVIVVPQRATFEERKLTVRTDDARPAGGVKSRDSNPPETPIATSLRELAASMDVHTKRYVYVVDKDHVAHRREIKVRDDGDDSFVIENGVVIGDRIVVDGVEHVRDGDKVE